MENSDSAAAFIIRVDPFDNFDNSLVLFDATIYRWLQRPSLNFHFIVGWTF